MKTTRWTITRTLLPVLALIMAGRAAPAGATAFADIDAGWSVQFSNLGIGPTAFPSGLSFSCFGGAASSGSTGCSDLVSLDASSANGSSTKFDETFVAGFTITNNSSHALSYGLNFDTDFSAFLPSGQGVWVTNPLLESASFTSSLSGPDAFDKHQCATSPHLGACTVNSADESAGFIYLASLGAGDSYTAIFDVTLDATLLGQPLTTSVPESGSLALVGVGLAVTMAGAAFRRMMT